MQELKESGVTMLNLTGGEFFVHPDSVSILRYALTHFPKVGLLTNGTCIPDEAYGLMAEHKQHMIVSVSIDSSRPEIHDSLRGKKGSFQIATSTISKLTSLGIQTRMASVISDINMWEIDKLANLARSLGAFAFSFD